MQHPCHKILLHKEDAEIIRSIHFVEVDLNQTTSISFDIHTFLWQNMIKMSVYGILFYVLCQNNYGYLSHTNNTISDICPMYIDVILFGSCKCNYEK